MKTIRNFSRFLIAPVFIFSGFVKAIDPLGSTYKITDYFEAFGLDFLAPIALPLAILLSTAELLIGLSLIMGVVMRTTSWVLLLFMSFFTVLTLIVAITNPVTDCGCFGDALILTNWQTFWKNIIFMVPTLIIFFERRMFKPFTAEGVEWGIVILFATIGVFLSIAAYRNLPFIDFRPYKIGVNIPAAMEVPEGAEMEEREMFFVYAKDGKEKEFKVEELTSILDDTTWKYVDRREVLIKKGYEPPIHDFTITSLGGEEIVDSILHNTDLSLLVISYDLNKANEKGLYAMNEFAAKLKEKGVNVYGMTSSTIEEIKNTSGKYNLNFDWHSSDETMLKTVVRANPGALLIKEGTIIGKWHYRNLPQIEEYDYDMLSVALQNKTSNSKGWVIAFFISLFFTISFFLVILIKCNL